MSRYEVFRMLTALLREDYCRKVNSNADFCDLFIMEPKWKRSEWPEPIKEVMKKFWIPYSGLPGCNKKILEVAEPSDLVHIGPKSPWRLDGSYRQIILTYSAEECLHGERCADNFLEKTRFLIRPPSHYINYEVFIEECDKLLERTAQSYEDEDTKAYDILRDYGFKVDHIGSLCEL